MKFKVENINDLREKLAYLEHEQWISWYKYMINNISVEYIMKWNRKSEINYYGLTEKEKESDRVWADRVIEILKAYSERE